jgi:hypothetical protein
LVRGGARGLQVLVLGHNDALHQVNDTVAAVDVSGGDKGAAGLDGAIAALDGEVGPVEPSADLALAGGDVGLANLALANVEGQNLLQVVGFTGNESLQAGLQMRGPKWVRGAGRRRRGRLLPTVGNSRSSSQRPCCWGQKQ